MRIDGNLITDLGAVPRRARELEDLGYDGAVSVETNHDPFLPLALAAEHTEHIDLLTELAIALARSPMTVAHTAHDIQTLSRGRLVLGLGSQIRAHVEKRFSMPYDHPAARMREYVIALRAIWHAWETGEPLRFRGDFYQHTLMTPFFSPGAGPYGPPRVFLGALGELMVEVAGEVADGILIHPMVTERYVREVTLPALQQGIGRSGRRPADVAVCLTPFLITGADEKAIEDAAAAVRLQIAFYGSTPAYRGVLELHGWGGLQGELNTLSKQGRWVEMGELVSDEMLELFAVRASLDELPARVAERWGGLADRMGFNVERGGVDRERWGALLESLRSAVTPARAVAPVALGGGGP
jgi:probable F420-dependent oxidoreductase